MKKILAIAVASLALGAFADAANTLIRFTAPVSGDYSLAWVGADGVATTVINAVTLEEGKKVVYQIDSAQAKTTGNYVIMSDGAVVAGVAAKVELGKSLSVGVVTLGIVVPEEYLAAVGATKPTDVVSTSGLTAAATYALGVAPVEVKEASLKVFLTMDGATPVVTTIPAEAANGYSIVIEGSTNLKDWAAADMATDKFFRAVIK